MAAAAGFTIIPSAVLGKAFGHVAPSDKVNLACCGIGNRGGGIIKSLHQTGLVNIVALCDTDMGATHTQEVMGLFPKATRYQDFRVMFDKMSKEIDAVSVGTPDFSHFPITMLAMSLGKHVYVEKPLARTFQEIDLMMEGARKYKVATQMGNQGHSEANYFQFKAWTEAGIIKDVTAITAHMNGGRRWHGWDTAMTKYPEGGPAPETLDWGTWLAASRHHDYHKDLVNGQWRGWYEFGMGALGDWGAHLIDTAHRFLQLGLPYEVDPVRVDGHNPFFFPLATTLDFKFASRGKMPPVTISWYDGVNNIPKVPAGYGDIEIDLKAAPSGDGFVQPAKLPNGKIIYGKDLVFKGGSHGRTLSVVTEEKGKELEVQMPVYQESPSNHFENFLKACKREEECRSSFDISGPLSQVFTLGVIAQRLNTKIIFDTKKKQITNHPLANDLLYGPPPRKGWEEFYKL